MTLTWEQYDLLMKPINPGRVKQRQQSGRTFSYIEAWDVKAHLIRAFGFGGFDADVTAVHLAYEEQDDKGRWQVGYRVTVRLYVHALGCEYTEAAVGSATLPSRGDAHDMALKSGESDALKRAAVYLGDQFGLSLYRDGSTSRVVVHNLRPVPEPQPPLADANPQPEGETVEEQSDE